MTSIRDLVDYTGFSAATISRVLNNHPHVAEETRETILQAIRELDYRPSQMARDLSFGQTHRIGVVVQHTRHPYFTKMLEGMMDAAKESSYQLLLLPSDDYDDQKESAYLEMLAGRAIDGLIFSSRALAISKIEPYADYAPIVLLEPVDSTSPLSSTYSQRSSAYVALFTRLKEMNLKRIALLFSRNSKASATYQMTLSAFEQVYEEKPVLSVGHVDSPHEVSEGLRESLKKAKPQAILATSDEVAAYLIKYYQDKEALLIIGQENQSISQILDFPTIDHHAYELGKCAFRQAISPTKQERPFTSKLIWR